MFIQLIIIPLAQDNEKLSSRTQPGICFKADPWLLRCLGVTMLGRFLGKFKIIALYLV